MRTREIKAMATVTCISTPYRGKNLFLRFDAEASEHRPADELLPHVRGTIGPIFGMDEGQQVEVTLRWEA